MSSIEEARYVLINAKSGTALDLSGEDNRSIIGYPRHGEENQQWETIRTDAGWHIRNVAHDTYLAVDGVARDDARVIAREEPFIWHLWDDEENPAAIRICVPDTQHNIDLTNYGDSEPGTPVAIWGRWNAVNQTWFFERGMSSLLR
ncbi:hypothetical protein D9619_008473 [Psilocybe cf. subviscida]|uniref:Ricin B lectin domain-containing protein n=1 Tax=Psilocybe cf. subviscida TaxID=2480587 RepID=A0A8H5BAC3_9AGAR|nr:hypothetical protein D9619_008473 [Psilocybe cf. subviscida]